MYNLFKDIFKRKQMNKERNAIKYINNPMKITMIIIDVIIILLSKGIQ